MNKYEIKYMLETMTSSVDRLTDSLGKQSHHISELWTEIGEKQNIITNQRYEIKKLKERLLEIFRKEHKDRLDDADFEKRYKEFVGESVDH
jgi:regulator of replication initiation timing